MTPDPANARIEREWKTPSPLVGCRFDPSGRFLFAAGQDATVRRLDLLTGGEIAFAGHRSWVRGMAFLPHGTPDPAAVARWEHARNAAPAVAGAVARPVPPAPAAFTVVSADYHGKLVWWRGDVDSPAPLREVAAHDGWVRAVAVSPDGRLVASCGNDHLVKLWTADGVPVRTLAGHGSHVYNVAFHPDGSRLASCDLKGVVKDWDVSTGACVRDLDAKALNKFDPTFVADIGGARGMAFAPGRPRLAVSGITNVSNAFAGVGGPVVLVFDWADGKAKPLKPKEAFQGTAWGVAFHPAGFVMAAGAGGGGRVWFWAGGATDSTHTVTVPAGGRDLALSPSGERFAVAGANGVAYVYSLRPGPPAATPGKPRG